MIGLAALLLANWLLTAIRWALIESRALRRAGAVMSPQLRLWRAATWLPWYLWGLRFAILDRLP